MCSKMYVLLSFSGGLCSYLRACFVNAIFTVHFDRQQKYYTSWPNLKGFLN